VQGSLPQVYRAPTPASMPKSARVRASSRPSAARSWSANRTTNPRCASA